MYTYLNLDLSKLVTTCLVDSNSIGTSRYPPIYKIIILPNAELPEHILLHGLDVVTVVAENTRQRHLLDLPKLSVSEGHGLVLVAEEISIAASRP